LAVAEDDICVKSQEQLHPNNKHNSPYQHSVLQIAITTADYFVVGFGRTLVVVCHPASDFAECNESYRQQPGLGCKDERFAMVADNFDSYILTVHYKAPLVESAAAKAEDSVLS
jgi:hypothetical protein